MTDQTETRPAEGGDYTVQLEIFEGPLDLLLHLIKQQELDIYDIPIARITDQYLHYLQGMRDLNITVAGEFLLMAAQLIYIKSQMLLPQEPLEDSETALEDPRTDLVERLLEHQRFKAAAHQLYEKETLELSVWTRGNDEFEEEEKEIVSANVFDLLTAFHRILERYRDQIVLEVGRETVTLEEKIREIRHLLTLQREFLFSMFLERRLNRMHLVVTLLALLELVRVGEIRLFQKGVFEDIRIVACPTQS